MNILKNYFLYALLFYLLQLHSLPQITESCLLGVVGFGLTYVGIICKRFEKDKFYFQTIKNKIYNNKVASIGGTFFITAAAIILYKKFKPNNLPFDDRTLKKIREGYLHIPLSFYQLTLQISDFYQKKNTEKAKETVKAIQKKLQEEATVQKLKESICFIFDKWNSLEKMQINFYGLDYSYYGVYIKKFVTNRAFGVLKFFLEQLPKTQEYTDYINEYINFCIQKSLLEKWEIALLYEEFLLRGNTTYFDTLSDLECMHLCRFFDQRKHHKDCKACMGRTTCYKTDIAQHGCAPSNISYVTPIDFGKLANYLGNFYLKERQYFKTLQAKLTNKIAGLNHKSHCYCNFLDENKNYDSLLEKIPKKDLILSYQDFTTQEEGINTNDLELFTFILKKFSPKILFKNITIDNTIQIDFILQLIEIQFYLDMYHRESPIKQKIQNSLKKCFFKFTSKEFLQKDIHEIVQEMSQEDKINKIYNNSDKRELFMTTTTKDLATIIQNELTIDVTKKTFFKFCTLEEKNILNFDIKNIDQITLFSPETLLLLFLSENIQLQEHAKQAQKAFKNELKPEMCQNKNTLLYLIQKIFFENIDEEIVKKYTILTMTENYKKTFDQQVATFIEKEKMSEYISLSEEEKRSAQLKFFKNYDSFNDIFNQMKSNFS